MIPPVYLDYAATAAIRPPEVADAVAGYLRDVGATPGRASHSRALDAGRMMLRCRRRLAELFAIRGDPGRIVMQFNATHALNTAIYGVLRPGDGTVRTSLDHNSVRRPIAHLATLGVEERILHLNGAGLPDWDQLDSVLYGQGRPARLLALPHASNVTGAVLPVKEISARARQAGALVLLDVAQTAGHLPIDVDALGVDLLAFTGHKGLLGPQGTGGLWVREGIDVAPLLRGGTGGDSGPADMPASYPDHLEAGTQNSPGIAGLLAGLDWILQAGVDRIRSREEALVARLVDRLRDIDGLKLISAHATVNAGIVTLLLAGRTPGELADSLEGRFGIQGRSGLHCAPDAHAVIGTLGTGAFRLSVGWATTTDDVDRAAQAISTLSHESPDN